MRSIWPTTWPSTSAQYCKPARASTIVQADVDSDATVSATASRAKRNSFFRRPMATVRSEATNRTALRAAVTAGSSGAPSGWARTKAAAQESATAAEPTTARTLS